LRLDERIDLTVRGRQRLRVVEFEKGSEHPEWCTTGHRGQVLEGKLGLGTDGEALEIGPGKASSFPMKRRVGTGPRPDGVVRTLLNRQRRSA